MEPERLLVRTIQVAEPGELLSRLPQSTGLAWVRHGEGLVGWGEAARLTLSPGQDRFAAASAWLRGLLANADVDDPVGVPGSGPVAFGSFTFDPAAGGSVLVVPRAVLGRRGDRAWFTTIGDGSDPLVPARAETPPGEVTWRDGSLTGPQWQRAVAAAVSRIKAGELSKVVLARDLRATTHEPIDARVLLNRLAAAYPDCYTFACAGLVGATPELLVRREGDLISSLVLGGTTSRLANPDADAQAGAALLASAKETEEHRYAVTSVADALRPLCGSISVEPGPSLLALANVQHLATWVTGRLGDDRSALALAAALHPTAAAVGGTPADRALRMIRQLEGMDRGRYA
ncbi:MAG: chorismate-binding protein, partial [Actinobacteria bacterium]|nr:chorismate-binding protein [Actinomycetota bacterium]